MYNNDTFNMEGGTITRCTASYGGGLYVAAGKTANISGGTIKANNASTQGGGIAAGNNQSRLVFSGNPKVEDNTLGSNTKCNVELSHDTDKIIQSEELNKNASIGIYVSPEEETLFDHRGKEGKPFGTHDGTHIDYLYCFVNDVNDLKGGIMGDDGLIYWVKVFALEVSKTVVSSESKDLNKQFRFKVTMKKPGGTTVKGKYGDMLFNKDGEALFFLKNGEKRTAENLIPESEYTVEEILDPNDQTYYATIPQADEEGKIKISGKIGVHMDEEESESQYLSKAAFTNLSAVCKITTSDKDDPDNDRILLYYQLENGSYMPAVYSRLQQAFDMFSPETPALFLKNGDTYTPYGDKTSYNVEMIVPVYDLPSGTTLQGSKHVTLRTADPNASDYPYLGSEDDDTATAVIQRSYKSGESMITVNGNLILQDIKMDGNKARYTASRNGGIAFVSANGNLTIQSGAELRDSKTSKNGGAVYVEPNGRLTVQGGVITGNSSDGQGAGIYLDQTGNQAATMYLSGNPDFGPTQIDTEGKILTTSGNFITTKYEGDKTNGGKKYEYARQDIYIAGYKNVSAESLVLAGELIDPSDATKSMPQGSIWVWANESDHFKSLDQFAKISNDAGMTPEKLQASVQAFRNAMSDDLTDADKTGGYLYGMLKNGDNTYIYWNGVEGSRRVVLRKVEKDNYTSIENAEFTIYTNKDGTSVAKDASGTQTLDSLESTANGTIYVGELNYGVYYVEETTTPSGYNTPPEGDYFIITVNENGVGYSTDNGKTFTHEVEAKTPTS